MRPRAKRLSGDHVHLKPPPERHVESFRQRRAAGVSLDLELGAAEHHAVKSKAGQPDEDCRARPVLKGKAQPVGF